jgi:hypothetical protein
MYKLQRTRVGIFHCSCMNSATFLQALESALWLVERVSILSWYDTKEPIG